VQSQAASLAASDRAALVLRAEGASVAAVGPPGGDVTFSGSDAGPARAYLAGAVTATWDDATWLDARGDGTGLLSLAGDVLGLARETKSWSATVREGPGGPAKPTLRLALRLTFHPGGPLARWIEEGREPEAAPSLALLPADVWAGGALASHALTAPWFGGLESVGAALGGEAAASPAATGEGPLAVGLWWTGEGPTLLAMRANPHDEAPRALRRTLESARSPLFSLHADVTRVSRLKADVVRLRVEDRRADAKASGAPRALALAATVSNGWLLAAAGHSPLDGIRALNQADRRVGEALAAEAASLCDGHPLLTAFFMPSKESGFASAADARSSPPTPTPWLGCVGAQPVQRALTLVIDVPSAR
jgi:hypothetical protein